MQDSQQPIYPSSVACPQCGYDLTGVALGSTCPECGAPVDAAFHRATTVSPTCGQAIASMVVGIVSIPACMCYGIPGLICGIVAIVLNRIAVSRMQGGGFSPGSDGMAKAGLICGIIGTVLGLLYAAFFIVMIVISVMENGGF